MLRVELFRLLASERTARIDIEPASSLRWFLCRGKPWQGLGKLAYSALVLQAVDWVEGLAKTRAPVANLVFTAVTGNRPPLARDAFGHRHRTLYA